MTMTTFFPFTISLPLLLILIIEKGHAGNDPTKRQIPGPSPYGPCACPPAGPIGCAPPIAALPPPPAAPVPPAPAPPAGRLIPQALPGAPCEPGVECTGGSVCSMGICLCPPELVQEGTVCVSRTIYGVVPPPAPAPPPAPVAYLPPPPPVAMPAPIMAIPAPAAIAPHPIAAAPLPCGPPFSRFCARRSVDSGRDGKN